MRDDASHECWLPIYKARRYGFCACAYDPLHARNVVFECNRQCACEWGAACLVVDCDDVVSLTYIAGEAAVEAEKTVGCY